MEDPALVNEQLTQMNRKRVEIESREINEFIARHHFNMRQTGTGLRFQIYERGKGVHPATRDEVKIRYKVFLLDGTFCYSTDSLGPVRFTIGINEQVRGLEEGLFLMVPGDKARLIVPAHLGYGMTGDGMHIPPESALYYDVELISINQ
jgi:FKBP-type peptidyl-prolyl cis-trans isomerase